MRVNRCSSGTGLDGGMEVILDFFMLILMFQIVQREHAHGGSCDGGSFCFYFSPMRFAAKFIAYY